MFIFYTVALVLGIVIFWGALSAVRNTITTAAQGMEITAARYTAANIIALTPEERAMIKELKAGL